MRLRYRSREYMLILEAEGRWGFFWAHVLLMGLAAELVGVIGALVWVLSLAAA